MNDKELREYLARVLTWGEAHADWKQALAGLDPAHRGVRPAGSPYSAWELLEHARISQDDILDFSTNPKYRAREWPASYWPNSPAPPDDAAWEKSLKEFANGTEEMVKLLKDPQTDLFAKIPHGTGQTMLRQAIVAGRPQCLPPGPIRAGAPAIGSVGPELTNESREFASEPL